MLIVCYNWCAIDCSNVSCTIVNFYEGKWLELDKARRNALKRIRVAFHKYTEWVFVSSLDSLTREEFEDTYTANRDAPVPTYDEMKEQIFSRLIEEKFRFVQVAPSKANCAIRIFRKEMKINDKPAGLCGAVCFVRSPIGKWTTIDKEGNEIEMDFEETYQVEYWTSLITKYEEPVRADYYDVYLKVVSF